MQKNLASLRRFGHVWPRHRTTTRFGLEQLDREYGTVSCAGDKVFHKQIRLLFTEILFGSYSS
jgi:hypothetical protein